MTNLAKDDKHPPQSEVGVMIGALKRIASHIHSYHANSDDTDFLVVRYAAEMLGRQETQLPDGMKDCTIIFKQCDIGHSWLTASNWIQFSCPTCKIHQLEAELNIERGYRIDAEETVEKLKETNRRLNRRCQLAESLWLAIHGKRD